MKKKTFSASVLLLTLLALSYVADAKSKPAHQRRSTHSQRALTRDIDVLPWQRILLKGDSITRGYGFGNYTDPSPLRTIQGIGKIILGDNLRRSPTFERLEGVWQGLNPDGSPKTVDTWAAELVINTTNSQLRAGDWLIFEDAGPIEKSVHPAPWPWTKNIYQEYRRSLREMVKVAEGVIGRDHIVFMTMFDYKPGSPNCGMCEWDAPLDDGVRTGNDAIRDEASALGLRLIDMNRIMDQANNYLTRNGWGRSVGPDGIHPNVYGNYVMTLAILGTLGADVERFGIDGLGKYFMHPSNGGTVPQIWGFTKNPTDLERLNILHDLRKIVTAELKNGASRKNMKKSPLPSSTSGFVSIKKHGRILTQTHRQPEGTNKPVTYELGKVFQLDKDTSLLVASMREQGGHDFAVGNDGFVFRKLSDISAEKAIPINRLDPNYKLKSGAIGVMGKFPASGAFVPLGAKLPNGKPHPAAGTGFIFSGTITFLPDRTEGHPQATREDRVVDFVQLRWDGKSLTIISRESVVSLLGVRVGRVGLSNYLPQDVGFLCPFAADDGSATTVIRFDWNGKRWAPTAAGKPFITAVVPEEQKRLRVYRYLETEASIQKLDDRYLVYTRGRDPKGRVYVSSDGLNYKFLFDRTSPTSPQTLNKGLDGSLYMATNQAQGFPRNPLVAYPLGDNQFRDGTIIHDEKGIRDSKGPEVPFVDHGVGVNILLEGRWRHFFLYRICDLRETNGEGAAPKPNTGLYMAEMEYERVTQPPHRF